MNFIETSLRGSYEIFLEKKLDSRGWFVRSFCKDEFKRRGIEIEWVQISQSFSKTRGTLRGMHFQYPPHCEVKLVQCLYGVVHDVIVDIRKDSSTFLQHAVFELSEKASNSLLIPEGFAHGFQCLTDEVCLMYNTTKYHQPQYEGGLRFDDPVLDIKWPLPISFISERDKTHSYIDDNFVGI